jgi:Tol biopolymer transport system component
MNSDGGNQRLLYDSGGHDADLDWVGDHIVFTRDSQIWMMNGDGTHVHQLTDPTNAGVWGNSVLPFGDYDPRISPDGSLVVFERLVNDTTEHGNYELFIIGVDGEGEHNITGTGWTQGIAQWSSTGEELIYLVSAIGLEGRYDIYRINADGSGITDLSSELYPPGFLAHHPIYAGDDSTIYFVGHWWNWAVLESTLTCSASKSTVSLGETITISVEVQPLVHDIEAELTITEPDGESHQTVTLSDGSYQFSYTPEQIGEYSVQAEWGGDLGHTGSTSTLVGFTVQEGAVPDDGIPGYQLTAIILGFMVFLVSRRHSYLRKP